MEVGQRVRAQFKTVPTLVEKGNHSGKNLYPIREGTVIWIHPKGRFLTVRTRTPGGDVVETFRPGEILT